MLYQLSYASPSRRKKNSGGPKTVRTHLHSARKTAQESRLAQAARGSKRRPDSRQLTYLAKPVSYLSLARPACRSGVFCSRQDSRFRSSGAAAPYCRGGQIVELGLQPRPGGIGCGVEPGRGSVRGGPARRGRGNAEPPADLCTRQRSRAIHAGRHSQRPAELRSQINGQL